MKNFPSKIFENGVNPVDKIYRSLNSTQEKVWDEVLRREQVMAEEAIPFGESLGELFRSNRVNDQRVADHLGFLKWWSNGGLKAIHTNLRQSTVILFHGGETVVVSDHHSYGKP